MLKAVEEALPADIAVMAAAVADWRVAEESASKIKKDGSGRVRRSRLAENPDILSTVGHHPTLRPQLVVGFAAETDDLIANARRKLEKKGADWILANDVSPETGVMGGERNTIGSSPPKASKTGRPWTRPTSPAASSKRSPASAESRLGYCAAAARSGQEGDEQPSTGAGRRASAPGNGEGLPLPRAQSPLAAGLDLPAAVPQDAPLTLAPGERALVPTGFAMALPPGFEGQVRPRSGLAVKHGITVLNAPGTIDADYRGEVKVAIINLGERAVHDHPRHADCPTRRCAGRHRRNRRSRRARRNRARRRRIRFDRRFGLSWRRRQRDEETPGWQSQPHAMPRPVTSPAGAASTNRSPTRSATRRSSGSTALPAEKGVRANLLAKLEFFNPIASVKDRIGVVDDRCARGRRARSSPAPRR